MKIAIVGFGSVLALAVWGAERDDAKPVVECPLFAFCMDTHDSKKRTVTEQAELLAELGFDGAGHLWLDGVAERIESLEKAGLELFQIYLRVSLDPKQPSYDARLPEVLKHLKGRRTQLAVLVSGGKPSDVAGDDRAVAILREIADLAAHTHTRIVLYPHSGDWLERVEDALRVIGKVERKNVGVMFNLCHFLRVDDEKSLGSVLEKAKPYLWAVSLHGSDAAAEVRASRGQWIRPLGEGALDVGKLLETLRDLGYRGPVGLQCYGLEGDAREHLKQSMDAWKTLRKRLEPR